MIEREIILNYYTYKETYYGSYKGMRYAIVRVEDEGQYQLKMTTWPEPFCYDKTSDDQKTVELFPFTEGGYDAGIAWLNVEYKAKYSKGIQG